MHIQFKDVSNKKKSEA